MAMSMGFATASYVNLTNYLNPAKKKKHIFPQNSCVAVPQLERCFRGARFLSGGGAKITAFFYNSSMLGSFVLEIRNLSATSEAEFNSPVGAGMVLKSGQGKQKAASLSMEYSRHEN